MYMYIYMKNFVKVEQLEMTSKSSWRHFATPPGRLLSTKTQHVLLLSSWVSKMYRLNVKWI